MKKFLFLFIMLVLITVFACSSENECNDTACVAKCTDEGFQLGGYCNDGECKCVDGADGDSDSDSDGDGDGDGDSDIIGNCAVYFQGNQLPPSPSDDEFATVSDLDFEAFPHDPCINPTSGRIIWVSTNGSPSGDGSEDNPVDSIKRGYDLAQSGDAVVIHGGHYIEGDEGEYRSLPIEKSDIIISGYPGEEVIMEAPSEDYNYGIDIMASNVAIRNMTIQGYLYSIVFQAEGISNTVLAGLKIIPREGLDWNEGIVVYPDGGGEIVNDGILFRGVEITNVGLGISCNSGPCANWRLEWVKIEGIPGSGNSGADTFAIENGDNFLLYKIETSLAGGDGIDCKGTRIAVFDCYVHDVDRNAIKFWQGGDIVNCLTFKSGADAAIVFDAGGTYRILNSIISYHNYQSGLNGYVMTVSYDNPSDSGSITIANSMFVYNNGGIFIADSFDPISIRNNLFYQNEDSLLLQVGDNRYEYSDGDNAISQNGWGGGNFIDVNPNFNNSEEGDFSFGSGSSACNSGIVSEPFPSSDKDGNNRIQGSSPDLGPVEYCN